MTAQSETRLIRGDTVVRAADAIRSLILSRDLFPGEQLRQDSLSERIGISRGPTREALQALSNEGLVTHSPNRGYRVTRFDFSEMKQLYELRDFSETELLRSAVPPSRSQIRQMRQINRRIAVPSVTVEQAMQLNQDFHFAMFGLSPKKLLLKEVERWWRMSLAYRALGIGIWADRAERMTHAHEEQLDALVAGDIDLLVRLSKDHRDTSLNRLEALLSA